MDGQVNKMIDQAAGVAKKQIRGMIGGDQAKDKEKQAGGIGDMVSGAIGKAAAQQATDKATEQALNFGKNLFK